VAVLVGTGGNGGRGMVCAHNLHNWGATVELFGVLGTNDFDPIPALPLVSGAQDLPEADLIIDALVGYSLSGPPRGALASLIRSAADVECPTLALDVPMSEVYEPAVKADATLRLALSKTGLAVQGAQAYVGELWLADIGVPPELYAKPTVGVRVRTPFNESDLVKLSD